MRFWLVLALTAILPTHGLAQDARRDLFRRFGMRLNGSVTFFISQDQVAWLGFARPGVVADLSFGMLIQPWLTLELGGTIGVFMSEPKLALTPEAEAPGGLLAPWLGARLHGESRRLAPFLMLGFGPGFTGDLVRPLFSASVGADVGVGLGASIGPVVGFSQLFQKDAPGASSDARFLWVGLSFAYRPLPLPTKVVTRLVHTHSVERVVEREVVREEVFVAPPAPPVDDKELEVLLDSALPAPSERVELLAPVLFGFDSDQLEPLGVAMLHEVADMLRRRTDIELVGIQGYADKRGSEEYNRSLARRRAERVKQWLIAHDIAADRLVVADGTQEAVEAGDSEPEHQQNRRVIFRVLRLAEAP